MSRSWGAEGTRNKCRVQAAVGARKEVVKEKQPSAPAVPRTLLPEACSELMGEIIKPFRGRKRLAPKSTSAKPRRQVTYFETNSTFTLRITKNLGQKTCEMLFSEKSMEWET